MMTGLFAAFHRFKISATSLGLGDAGLTGGMLTAPKETFVTGGEKSTSMGKSITTGPGAPDTAVRQA